MDAVTIDEIAKALSIPPTTAYKRIQRAGIKPISSKALYDPAVIEAIRNPAKGGRPPKPKE